MRTNGNSRCFPRGLFQEHSYKERRSNTKPVQKDIHVSVPPQGKKEGKTLQHLHALYRKQGPSEESNKNPYEHPASRYVENILFPISDRWTIVLLG